MLTQRLPERAFMKRELTARLVEKPPLPPASKERVIYWDQSLSRLGLMVTAKGHKSWIVQYRVGGRSHRITLDGILSLKEARDKAHEILSQVAKGDDPAAAKRKARTATNDTFGAIAESYLRIGAKELRSAALYRRTLERLVLPELGKLPIGEIRRSQIASLLDDIVERNGEVMADLTLAIVRRVFTWHATRDDHFVSPLTRGMARSNPQKRARSRILTDDELSTVWKATGKPDDLFGAYVRFLLLTAARRDEATEMSRSEIKDGVWTIPASRYKTGVDTDIPLSAAALEVLEALPRIGPDKYVFTRDGARPFQGHSSAKERLDKACGFSDWVIHDLRRTARSLMSRAGVSSDIAEQCLGHKLPGVRAIYDRHRYLEEKRHAFEAVAALIDRIVNPPADNVVAIGQARI
jgi:integrase